MTFKERINEIAIEKDLFPELTSAEKKYDYILADIAIKIRNKRKSLAMTQKEFAKFVGVSQGMISKWESAEYNFSLESIVNLFDRLDIKIDIHEKRKKANIKNYRFLSNQSNWVLPHIPQQKTDEVEASA